MTDVVEALSTSVTAIDGARRVGWAKAYAAEARAEDVSRDLNIARGDVQVLMKFAAFMYGVVQAAAPEALQRIPKQIDQAEVTSMLASAPLHAGRRAGRATPAASASDLAEENAHLQQQLAKAERLLKVLGSGEDFSPTHVHKLRRENQSLRTRLREAEARLSS
jgi:hypothetical protein